MDISFKDLSNFFSDWQATKISKRKNYMVRAKYYFILLLWDIEADRG